MAGEVPGRPALEVTGERDEAAEEALLVGLRDHNRPFLGEATFRHLGVLARGGGGRLSGGLTGRTSDSFLYIDLLWVAEAERGRGLGSRLILAAEAEAVTRGCRSAVVDTFDFQARPFYERHGYAVFGTLDGYRDGHRRFFMVKRLDGSGRGG